MRIDFIAIFPDNTHIEKRCTVTKSGKVKFDKDWQPQLEVGRSTFLEREKTKFSIFSKFRRKKRRAFGVYGEAKCYTIDALAGKLNKDWNKQESINIIRKAMAWSLARTRLFSKGEFYILVLLLGVLLILRFYQLMRFGF